MAVMHKFHIILTFLIHSYSSSFDVHKLAHLLILTDRFPTIYHMHGLQFILLIQPFLKDTE